MKIFRVLGKNEKPVGVEEGTEEERLGSVGLRKSRHRLLPSDKVESIGCPF